MTTRRRMIATLAATALLPRIGWAEAGNPAWLACAREASGGFALFGLLCDGGLAFRQPLAARGHAGARHPSLPLAVVMARRPGTYALVIDCVTGRVRARLTPPEGLQFNGHAAFLDGGAALATSEQRAQDSAGMTGIWDTDSWQRVATWSTQGLGPHEIMALPQSRLAVANGGIATDPTDRRKLNLPSMRPSIAVLDGSGRLDDRMDLPDRWQNSIRHLALHPDGNLAFAMQWEGGPTEPVPLLGLWQPGSAPRLATAPEPEQMRMKGYAGSVAWSGGGERVAITSPRGGRVQVYDAAGGFLLGWDRPDVCGLGGVEDGFVATDGTGAVLRFGQDGADPLARHPLAWDNHMIAV